MILLSKRNNELSMADSLIENQVARRSLLRSRKAQVCRRMHEDYSEARSSQFKYLPERCTKSSPQARQRQQQRAPTRAQVVRRELAALNRLVAGQLEPPTLSPVYTAAQEVEQLRMRTPVSERSHRTVQNFALLVQFMLYAFPKMISIKSLRRVPNPSARLDGLIDGWNDGLLRTSVQPRALRKVRVRMFFMAKAPLRRGLSCLLAVH